MTTIAMWSGPRCLSTAVMRAWENRADAEVWDEPLYANYLAQTGLDHPGRAEVIAAGIADPAAATAACAGPAPAPIWFQKHMAHHLLPGMERGWFRGLRHCLLIRDPRAVVASYARTRPEPTVDDVGLLQLLALWHELAEITGRRPPVITCGAVLRDPRGLLSALCDALEVPFDDAMLAWPPGPRQSDGVWAPWWYASVRASTGFGAYRPPPDRLPDALEAIAEACRPAWERLSAAQLRASPAR